MWDTPGWAARRAGHCHLWNPGLVWLHAVSDLGIAVAYLSIPVTLLWFSRRRRELPFRSVLILFALFIVSCGFTHALSVWTIWTPVYRLSGGAKALTAAVSLITAVVLVRVVPLALQMRGPEELERLNASLKKKIAQRSPIKDFVFDVHRNDGSIVTLRGNAIPPLDKQGGVRSVVGAFTEWIP